MTGRPQTMEQAFRELGEAMHEFVYQFAKSLYIDRLADWLAKKLERWL